ncbi:MAG: ureidoglycolate lyase [Caulobacter sp.]|nr:ureidoglycolate lyase [Caulobacter sp.]
MRTLTPQPLTPEAFAPFGEVIFADPAKAMDINYGNTVRFNDLARVAVDGGHAIVSLFRSIPLEPLELKIMERHPLGSQAFMPLNGRPYLVVVAPPGDLDPDKVQAFLAGPNQGVNYAPGVWHHFLLALGEVSDFLVIDREGPEDNCDEVELTEALAIAFRE